MTITTLYDEGEKIWILYHQKAKLVEIKSITIATKYKEMLEIDYFVDVSETPGTYMPHIVNEKDMFKSKEELIKYISE